jgi:hypothetical protein
MGDHKCSFRRQQLIRCLYIRYILEKKWEYNGTVHQVFVDFKKAYDSVRREALYDILIEFGIPRKLVVLIKMCLNETYSTGKNLSDKFTIQNGHHCFSNLPWNMPSSGSERKGETDIEWDTSAFGLGR